MDALEFLKEHKRICNTYSRSDNGCRDCPLVSHCIVSSATSDEDFKKMTDVVEQWSKEHPRKTRQSEFLKEFPNVQRDSEGIINISPCAVDMTCKNSNCYDNCARCRHKYWLQEAE